MIRRLAALTLLAVMATVAPVHAQDQPISRREKLSPALQKALKSGARSVRVLVRMRGHRGAAPVANLTGAPAAMQLAVRRDEARQAAASLLEYLQSSASETRSLPAAPGSPRASETARADAGRPTQLWIANSVCLEASARTLDELAARPDVAGIYQDVRIQAIPRGELVRGGAADAAAAEAGAQLWGLEKVGAARVWNVHGLRGEGIAVGHIDTGVDASHPAMVGKVLRFKDFVNGRAEPYDDDGHGTHTAGTLCGSGLGVAPAAKLIVAKALDSTGTGMLSTLLAAMQWMLDPDGDPATHDAPVCVSNSWGIERKAMTDLGAEETFFWDAVQAWRDAGTLPLFAAGNTGAGTEVVPGVYPIALAVGATDALDGSPAYSAGGPSTWNGLTRIKPDLCAPGAAIVSAVPGGKMQSLNGTSMACPHVAGVVALVKQARPSVTLSELGQILRSTLTDLGPAGADERFGAGQIDAMAAVNRALSLPSPGSSHAGGASTPAPTPEAARQKISGGLVGLLLGLAALMGLALLAS
ncbi:MAG: S8 family serine peptidase [Candidatus Riflebacteria bacterium]|nr:S8 family serine peptidase [Candidatus Riflebacteria bacterium]